MIAISFNTDLFLNCIIAWLIVGAIVNILCGIVHADKPTREQYGFIDIFSGLMILIFATLAVLI